MPLHGGKLAARSLKQAGVECIFTLSGGHIMPLYDGCLDEGIRIVDVRHEQAAVHAADSWARCNPGKIGVAAITAGPGVTDGVTGVANAWRANSPILVFGGQGPFANLRRGSLQEMDHIGVMRPITKYADAIYQTHRIPEYIELAIRHAVSGIPGPAYLEIPMDVFMGQAEESQVVFPRIRTEPPRISPDREEVRRAIALLEHAKRPLLMAGTSVKWSRASAAMCRFIQETHIPSFTNGMGRGTIPPELARVPEPLAARGAREDRLRGARGDPARLPHALRPDDPRRREDHPARDGRHADRAEPRNRRPAGRQPRLQLRALERGDEEPGRAPGFLGLPRRAARDRGEGRAQGRGGARQRRGADRPAAAVPRGARLARHARRIRS